MHREVNFDGLIGPTHNYAGLAMGNLASAKNFGAVSNPRAAALQGLSKMRSVMELGLTQGFLPPQDRPALRALSAFGFSGSDEQMITAAAQSDGALLANLYSASSMWSANAGTIAPSPDTPDGKVHFRAANLATNFHRAIEADTSAKILKLIFDDKKHFLHHPPLPGALHFGDEGAANHGRFCADHGAAGLHLFVYGVDGERFPARQKQAASHAVARGFGVKDAFFVQQSTTALDAGAFHNDVVSVVNNHVLFTHEQAFDNQAEAIKSIRAGFPQLEVIEAPKEQVSLDDAISSYLFNSQLLSLPDNSMALILPAESQENERVHTFLNSVVEAENAISKVIYKDVRESMRNGGGPACLRLRVVLSEDELAATNQNFILDDRKLDQLEDWVKEHYRDQLSTEDLADPLLAAEALTALDKLTGLLEMGSFYSFQQ